MSSEVVRHELEGRVLVVNIDDGKANALSHEAIDALGAALDRAEAEARAVLFVGRPGKFCAGFDLETMRAGPEASRGLVKAGAELLVRIFTFRRPTIVACTGHALAAGGIWLMAADSRVGVAGEFKIGLPEVALGMTTPVFLVEMARHRLSRRHLTRAVTQGEVYRPEAAVDAGFLDEVAAADELLAKAKAEAARLAKLPEAAFKTAKDRERGAIAETVLAGLEADMLTFSIEG